MLSPAQSRRSPTPQAPQGFENLTSLLDQLVASTDRMVALHQQDEDLLALPVPRAKPLVTVQDMNPTYNIITIKQAESPFTKKPE